MKRLPDGRSMDVLRYTPPRPLTAWTSAWTTHQVWAMVDGEPAGYLSISHITSADFQAFFPSLLHYVHRMRGIALLDRGQDFDLQRPDDVVLWQRLAQHLRLETQAHSAHQRLQAITEDLPHALRLLDEKYAQSLADFQHFHLQRPMAETLRVYTQHDLYANHPDGSMRERMPRSFMDLGIETWLMQEAALWMAEEGLALHGCLMELEGQLSCNIVYQQAWASMETLGFMPTTTPAVYDVKSADRTTVRVPRPFLQAA